MVPLRGAVRRQKQAHDQQHQGIQQEARQNARRPEQQPSPNDLPLGKLQQHPSRRSQHKPSQYKRKQHETSLPVKIESYLNAIYCTRFCAHLQFLKRKSCALLRLCYNSDKGKKATSRATGTGGCAKKVCKIGSASGACEIGYLTRKGPRAGALSAGDRRFFRWKRKSNGSAF